MGKDKDLAVVWAAGGPWFKEDGPLEVSAIDTGLSGVNVEESWPFWRSWLEPSSAEAEGWLVGDNG